MALLLSPSERQLAHQLLGISDQELLDIEKAPFRQAEERLKKVKARAHKAFKKIAFKYHPDTNRGDRDKALVFSLLVRAKTELDARQAKPDAQWIDPSPPQTRKWNINTVAVPTSGARPSMQVNVRRIRAKGSSPRLDPREQAARLGKMRP